MRLDLVAGPGGSLKVSAQVSTSALILPDPAATEAAGARLAPELVGGMVITLSGDLGAGKTTLARGCLRALGWTGPVKSPTYTLVEHYSFSSLYFYHFDFYRFNDPDEWDIGGFADYFRDDAVCMVEWPERVGERLSPADLSLVLRHSADAHADGRHLTLDSRSKPGERCLIAITFPTALPG